MDLTTLNIILNSAIKLYLLNNYIINLGSTSRYRRQNIIDNVYSALL